jgi:hypothetical protein
MPAFWRSQDPKAPEPLPPVGSGTYENPTGWLPGRIPELWLIALNPRCSVAHRDSAEKLQIVSRVLTMGTIDRGRRGTVRQKRKLKGANAHHVEGIVVVIHVPEKRNPVGMVSADGIGVFNGNDALIFIQNDYNVSALGQTLFHTVEVARSRAFGGANRTSNVSGDGLVLGGT